MAITARDVREYLTQGNFRDLFVRALGWDNYNQQFQIDVPPDTYSLLGQAEKRGMAVFVCDPGPDGHIPDAVTRRKIEKTIAKSVHEHIVIYVDTGGTTQVWQWVKREAGKPDSVRETTYHAGQLGERLVQRLNAIAFTLDEEDALGIVDVAGRVRAAFDVDKVTKRFYELFKTEHGRFLNFIQGISEQGDREWYASLMLNRLMFVYFIQKKGFLDGDPDYLRNRLKLVRQLRGQDQFLSFYRYFLLRLFHEGLGQSHRSPQLDALLGTVPYLNGGLFDVHQLEQRYADIEIADEAFEQVFAFFDQYEWHLDTRPLRKDNEINPDVLGYIFEKYINQKQMGAYYTKEDITGYISRNTIIPFLFDEAKKRCAIAFEPNGSVWSLLRDNPDRYIYEPVRKGVDLPLPTNIAAGVHDVSKRGDWNRPAAAEYALPTETWREHVARRERCYEVRKKLASGQVADINDLVTYNLDIVQFAQDVIYYCEGPELLRAFYRAIEAVTVLDPTCGSGAFLFAALNILEPLYDGCLDRMQTFVDDLDRSEEPHSPHKFKDFREVLADVARHPNPEYFIRKAIILNNLYGVDIMEEAVEIAKLRLFLTLVAQVVSADQIEPLPDIDFNIRAGNSLVGFATYDEARRSIEGVMDARGAVQSRMDFGGVAERIRQRAQDVEALFARFRRQQTEYGGEVTHHDKLELRQRLDHLDLELDRYLASEYGIDRDDRVALERWRASHQPFHWFVEFYGVMKAGGFDVVIGNPPYVEYKDVRGTYSVKGYETLACGDLYAFVTERSYEILTCGGYIGVIVPISIFGTDGFKPLQAVSLRRLDRLWVSSFANRPSQLFDGAQKRLTILLGRRGSGSPLIATSSYVRWKGKERDHLFDTRVQYAQRAASFQIFPASLEKLGNDREQSIFLRLLGVRDRLGGAVEPEGSPVYYTRKFGYFLAFLDFVPRVTDIETGETVPPSELKDMAFHSPDIALGAIAALTSTTFFWFWNVLSDCRNLNRRDLLSFPVDLQGASCTLARALAPQAQAYLNGLRATSRDMIKSGLRIQTFEYADCKPLVDDIDRTLADLYGFTDEELDFIINYDIKYRIGQGRDG